MNTLFRKWGQAVREALNLPLIEQKLEHNERRLDHNVKKLDEVLEELRAQESRAAAVHALVLDQQYLLLEKIAMIQNELHQEQNDHLKRTVSESLSNAAPQTRNEGE